MNRDSRKLGKGAKPAKRKRIIRGKAEQIAKLPAAEPPPTLTGSGETQELKREQLRELALDELARHAVEAARAIGESTKQRGKRERGAGQREAAQKWLLQAVFDLIAAPASQAEGAEDSGDGGPSFDNVVNLAEQRRELAAITRRQRRDMNK